MFVAVSDRGPGIATEELERVTERFYRGRGTPAGGSGLGLTIARQLAEKWGGTLEVSNGEGGGTGWRSSSNQLLEDLDRDTMAQPGSAACPSHILDPPRSFLIC